MPYCDVVIERASPESPDTALNSVGVKIFYRTYGHGPTKALLIIGLAGRPGTHESWNPQIKGLTWTTKSNDGRIVADDETTGGIEVCAFDNRGMGRSSVLTKRSVLHGRDDVIAQICYARRLAQKLYPVSRMVDLHGGHLVSHERTQEVNQALLDLIKASEMNTNPNDWTKLGMEDPGYLMRRIASIISSSEGKGVASLAYSPIEKFHHFLLFLFSLLVLAFGYARRALEVVNPVKLTNLWSPHHQRVFPDQKDDSSSKLELIQV